MGDSELTNLQIILIVICSLLFITVIALTITLIFVGNSDTIGNACKTTSDCNTGQICNLGTCMVSPGGKCNVAAECIGVNMGCYDHVCREASVEDPIEFESLPTEKVRPRRLFSKPPSNYKNEQEVKPRILSRNTVNNSSNKTYSKQKTDKYNNSKNSAPMLDKSKQNDQKTINTEPIVSMRPRLNGKSKPNTDENSVRNTKRSILSNNIIKKSKEDILKQYSSLEKDENTKSNDIQPKSINLIEYTPKKEDITDKTIKGNLIHMYVNAEDEFVDNIAKGASPYDIFPKSPLADIIVDNSYYSHDKYFTLCQIKGDDTSYVLNGITDNIKDFTLRNGQLLLLFEDGTLKLKKGESYTEIKSSLHMDEITSFNNFVYGNCDGVVYSLSQIKSGEAVWNQEDAIPENIRWWSTTSDGQYFWVQDSSKGYLYNRNMKMVDQADLTETRIYGPDKDIFVTLDKETSKGILSYDGTVVNDIIDGTFTSDGLIKITPSQYRSGTMSVKNLNNDVYYIASKSINS